MFSVAADEMHENPMGSMHGGIVATLVDSAMGCAVFSMLPVGTAYTTLELKTNYVRPIVQNTGVVRAEGRVVHIGGRVATTEARVVDADGTLYAHATSTCLIIASEGRSVMTRTSTLTLADGSVFAVRPIEAGDVERLRRMFDRLSPTTVYRRFFSPVLRPSNRMLLWLTNVDHDCREALVALQGDEIVAVARYDGRPGSTEAEIAVTVEDAWQHRGLGLRLVRRLAAAALDHGFEAFIANMLAENRPALGLVRKLSPDASVIWDDGGYLATVPLSRAS